jgi:hypothetical protein
MDRNNPIAYMEGGVIKVCRPTLGLMPGQVIAISLAEVKLAYPHPRLARQGSV